MNKYYPNLWSPVRIGNLTVKNRIEAAPVGMSDLTPEGYLTPLNIAAYEVKARGGAGIVTLGESSVHTKTGKAHGRMIPLDDQEILPYLIQCTDAIHRHGAYANIELLHPGRRSNPLYYDGTTWGPSDGAGVAGQPVKAMPKELIEEVVSAFGDAAEMAKLGGCDMVMVHMGHGWLVHQFMSPLNNQRTDEFGGSLENRCRLAMMIIDDIKKKCGENFPIDLRISGSELTEGGFDLEDMKQFAKWVDGKVALINVSDGTFHVPSTNTTMVPSMFLPHGCNVYLAEAVRKVVTKTKVSALGGISDPDMMEEIIAQGRADMVTVGRALIADPDLPVKARDGRAADITPCQRCIVCMSGSFVPYVKYATRAAKCTVNPQIGKELEVFNPPVSGGRKKVLIAGGGPAGMEAAVRACDRGHQVILCEKTDSLGGAIKYAKYVSFKQDLDKYMHVMEQRVLNRKEITLFLNTTVTPEMAEELKPDVLVMAIGAKAFIPPIPGIDGKNVVPAVGMHENHAAIGNRVVVIGGGLIGCEEALELAKNGHEVTVLEMREDVAIDSAYLHREALLLELEKQKEHVKLFCNMSCSEIRENGVTAVAKNGEERFFAADTVLVAAGMRPFTEETEKFRYCAPDFQVIGDCYRPARVLEAAKMGYNVAMHL